MRNINELRMVREEDFTFDEAVLLEGDWRKQNKLLVDEMGRIVKALQYGGGRMTKLYDRFGILKVIESANAKHV